MAVAIAFDASSTGLGKQPKQVTAQSHFIFILFNSHLPISHPKVIFHSFGIGIGLQSKANLFFNFQSRGFVLHGTYRGASFFNSKILYHGTYFLQAPIEAVALVFSYKSRFENVRKVPIKLLLIGQISNNSSFLLQVGHGDQILSVIVEDFKKYQLS